jgi:hypothetical protein
LGAARVEVLASFFPLVFLVTLDGLIFFAARFTGALRSVKVKPPLSFKITGEGGLRKRKVAWGKTRPFA